MQLSLLLTGSGEVGVNSLAPQQMESAETMGTKRPSEAWEKKEETSETAMGMPLEEVLSPEVRTDG